LSQFIEVGWEKKTLISACNQRNQTISLVVDAMIEAEGKSKYQILQKRKIKYHSTFFFLQKLNANTKLQKLKRRRNTKTITKIEQKYQIAEVEGKSKYQVLQKKKTKYHSNFIFYFFCRNLTQIPNCRNWREDEIPKQLQRQNRNTKLQKLIPNCRNWREDEIPKQL